MVSDSISSDTIKRVYVRIMPFLILCYIVAFLDRVNLGFAALHMNTDLGFTPYVYGLGAGIFSLGYFVFEVPSNLALHKVGARIWIPRIMITWGIISAGFAFVYNENSFYVMRFLLGAAEAGFFPGIVFYLSKWFPSRLLGGATAIFILGLPVSVLIGAPVSTVLLETMGGMAGLKNWQWMFVVEGVLSVVVGIVAYFVLTKGPEDARWLTHEQRDWLVRTLAAEKAAKEQVKSYGVVETPMSGKVLLLAFAIFCNIGALFGVTLWMPQIIKGFGGLSNTQAGLLTAVPYFCAGVAMVLNGWHSDKTGERRFHILIPACIGGLSLAMAGFSQSPLAGMIAICIGASGILASNILFWPLPSTFLTGAAAAAGIGLVNSVGNLGGFVGPYINGWAKEYFGDYSASMCVLGGMVALYGVIICTFLTVNARTAAGARTQFAPLQPAKAD
ncbi:MFS transporter [Bradyrhizobium sp. SYSU BS000235]|uniref:MFS transporter n=1 Tax=Bradyrhizobium sp. SYSU BS000235 TaxID=3411332 RepID=UPI003C7656AD